MEYDERVAQEWGSLYINAYLESTKYVCSCIDKMECNCQEEIINMKEIIKNEILEYCETTNNISEAIYMIDDILVDGEFDYGCRGLDHNALLGDGYGWKEILENGVVIVPETQTYISDSSVMDLDELGYERLPLNKNHIKGY